MHHSKLAKRGWLVLFGAACVAYLYGLGAVPLLGADEPRYAQVAREMYLRGDLVTPTLGGFRWFEKPPLLYWAMMPAFRALGFTETAARLGPALAGLLTVFFVARLALKVERETGGPSSSLSGFGLTATAVVASSGGMLVFSRGASFDVLLTAAVAASLCFFYGAEVEREAGRRRLLLAGFYACAGLSLLSKGLVGAVLIGGIVAAYFLLRGRWPSVRGDGLLWGPVLAVAVAAVWYAPAYGRNGWEFVDQFIIQHHFARYVSNKYQHPQPFYFYLAITPLLALPWTFFLGGGLWGLLRERLRPETPEARVAALALAWLAVPVLFFSFSGSKLPGYVLPALPGAALLAALRVTKYLRGEGGAGLMRATGAAAVALGAAAIIYALRGGALAAGVVVAVAAPALVAGVLALVYAGRRRALCVSALVAGAMLSVVLIAALALAQVSAGESVRGLVERADAEGLGPLPVIQLHDVERTAEFYAAGRLVYGADGQPLKLEGPVEAREAARARGGRALVLVRHEFAYQLDNLPGTETRLVADNGAHALYDVKIDTDGQDGKDF